MPRSGHFTHGKDRVPILQEAGWVPGPVTADVGNIAATEIDPRTVQPVASRYTDRAIPTHLRKKTVHQLYFLP
jgi:hypothetical protein